MADNDPRAHVGRILGLLGGTDDRLWVDAVAGRVSLAANGGERVWRAVPVRVDDGGRRASR